ncbi:MAG: hypothetical protein PHR77_20310 [Kiritimatiellae bacterium]|nr:hypothetical protein [Kiritimatiellia bacterium]MDD5519524.1 hypothetical protein [Kiritimatiellia bacterium]
MKQHRIQVGVVGVDSGQLIICDPCYIDSEWQHLPATEIAVTHSGEFNYQGVCCTTSLSETGCGQLNYKLGHPGVGVACGNFGGDGVFPVYVELDAHGQARRLIVEFH